jgi:lipoyl(octanoyl) transferase
MIQVLHLGHVDYNTALDLQKTLVDLRKRGVIQDTLLLLEHPPVITLGRNAKQTNIVASAEFLAQRGVELIDCDRGGDVTFHGPGQLVGYPIFDLRALNPKIGVIEYVRRIEEVLIRSCGDLGIPCARVAGLTGVWTTEEPQAKIAAIGVHISRAVTSHGFALNVSTDLDYFKLIVPCGISDKPVTSMQRELETPALSPKAGDKDGAPRISMEDVMPVVTRNFGSVFKEQVLWLESLNDLLPTPEDTPARAPEELRRMHGEDVHLA